VEKRAKYKQSQITEASFLPALRDMIRLSEGDGVTLTQILEYALDGDDIVAMMGGWIGKNPVGQLIDTDKYRELITGAIVQFAAEERDFSERNLYVLKNYGLVDYIDPLGFANIGELFVHEVGDWVVVEANTPEGKQDFYSPHIHGIGGVYPSFELALLSQISRKHYVTLRLIYDNERRSKR